MGGRLPGQLGHFSLDGASFDRDLSVKEDVRLAVLYRLGAHPGHTLVVEFVPLAGIEGVASVMAAAGGAVVTNHREKFVLGNLRDAVRVQVRPHVQALHRKTDGRGDLAAKHQLVSESFQVYAQYFRQL